MLSRRKFIAASTALVGGAATAAAGVLSTRASATASTLNIALKNATTSGTVYAYITGLALDNGNALFLLQSDGHTPYYPANPGGTGAPLGANCAIALGAPGSTVTTTIPHLAGARIWFSVGAPLTFLLNPGPAGPALVEPSVSNPSDPSINVMWDFCEFTYNNAQMFANISYVDFVSLPVSLTLSNTSGATQHVSGMATNGLDTVCNGLIAQNNADGAGWNKLVVTSGGRNLRALSPTNGIVMNSSLLSGYFNGYLNQVWSKYSTTPLTVDTQAQWGALTGQVSGGQLNFNGVAAYAQPSSADIFGCNSGPFAPGSAEKNAVSARISAALNRSTLLSDASQPDGENPAAYYANSVTNHYARIVHATNLDGRGYAFPYDDVAPNGGADLSGAVNDPNPVLLTVAVGGVGAYSSGGGGGGTPSPTPSASSGGGGGGTVSAFSTIQAEAYTSQSGTQTESCTDSGGGQDVGWIANGDWLGFANVDFGGGATQFTARVASGAAAGVSGLVQVALDSPNA
ncbi:MAG: beta-1,3-glucanase family protein, partial [Actinocrinis sp.]